MRTILYRLFFCCILLLTGIAIANVSAKDVTIIGDVNGDEQVTISDVVNTINYILGNPVSDFNITAADVNGDGDISITDVGCIINIVLEIDKVTDVDTIKVLFQDNQIYISGNYDENRLKANISGTQVQVKSSGKQPFVCLAEGMSSNGNLIIDADTTCTLILNNLQLTSGETAAISFPKKQKVNIELPKGTESVLGDATSRKDKDGANACLYSKGTLSFSGNGTLSVLGKYGHGIASSKNISVDGSRIVIADVVKNGIHCDKFTLKKGQIGLHLQSEASKGIKAKEELVIKGGTIDGEATGGITNDNGDLSYCSLIKSDGSMTVSGGTLTLKQSGDGGRCISVDKDLTMTGGTMNLECYGDGGQYQNTENEQDYYTPKCITVDDSVKIMSGTITCLSTGLGGKGIVAGKHLSTGFQQNDENLEPPIIRVETRGECIINNEDEDLRFGCPKGIKSDSILIIYDGDIAVTTAGMGGEGVECNGEMYIKGGTLECNTFDDGINVGKSIEISGGHVYCNSVDNDGIDSNGIITISGGVVASINQNLPNHSFDSESGQFYLIGGTVFGIGSMPVEIKESTCLFYNTQKESLPDGTISYGLNLQKGKYIYLQDNNKVIMALKNDNRVRCAYLTLADSKLLKGSVYYISEGDCPINARQTIFDNKMIIEGTPVNTNLIADIQL